MIPQKLNTALPLLNPTEAEFNLVKILFEVEHPYAIYNQKITNHEKQQNPIQSSFCITIINM